MTIGVAITTRNRRALFDLSFQQWRRWLPSGSVLVVVDDASDKPLTGDVDFRNGSLFILISHETRLGVAVSKNDGLAALLDAGCDELFLVDDDIHPTCDRWWKPYLESPEPHLSYQGPRSRAPVAGGDDAHYAVEFPRGFMLYVRRDVIDVVGGMDPAYGMWGGEHAEWQLRIHKAGLTTWPYADVVNSDRHWHTFASGSTVGHQERKQMLAATDLFWQKESPRFVPFRAGHHEQDWSLLPKVRDVGTWPLLRHVLDLQPQGVAVEFGVGQGNTTRIIAERMPVVGFDSFRGLPEDWRPGYPKGCFARRAPVIDNATIIPGWFDDTVPAFDFAALGYVGLWNIDCDLYSSTRVVLNHIGPYLRRGSFVYFDEIWDYEGHEEHELKAWTEFAEESKLGWTTVGYGPSQCWAIRIG